VKVALPETMLLALQQRFGSRCNTSLAMREQHGQAGVAARPKTLLQSEQQRLGQSSFHGRRMLIH